MWYHMLHLTWETVDMIAEGHQCLFTCQDNLCTIPSLTLAMDKFLWARRCTSKLLLCCFCCSLLGLLRHWAWCRACNLIECLILWGLIYQDNLKKRFLLVLRISSCHATKHRSFGSIIPCPSMCLRSAGPKGTHTCTSRRTNKVTWYLIRLGVQIRSVKRHVCVRMRIGIDKGKDHKYRE